MQIHRVPHEVLHANFVSMMSFYKGTPDWAEIISPAAMWTERYGMGLPVAG